jgi:hypothetical protein
VSELITSEEDYLYLVMGSKGLQGLEEYVWEYIKPEAWERMLGTEPEIKEGDLMLKIQRFKDKRLR